MSFDFDTYLFNLTGTRWLIHELSGGNANHTVRAVQKHEPDDEQPSHDIAQRVLRHPSVVLKQAPPYFAKFPEMSFSQHRQTIEAKALKLFDLSLADVLCQNPAVAVPQLLYHDLSSHVIIQSDLGAHPTLDVFLSSPSTTPHLASLTGAALGRFLATLHLHPLNSPHLSDDFVNADAEIVMQAIIANATEFMRDAGVSDFEVLGRRAAESWKKRNKTVFGQGDIWFGTVLINTREDEIEPTIGICDWEFAGPNHPAGDIAQLGSYLHLSSLSPLTTVPLHSVLITEGPHSCSKARYSVFKARWRGEIPARKYKNLRFWQSVCGQYRAPRPTTIVAGIAFSSAFYSAYFPRVRKPELAQEFQRSLLVMHAWELVNAAAWRHHLWCHCSGIRVKCIHVVEMVKEGARLLRATGEEVDWSALEDIRWCRFLRLEGPIHAE